MKKSTNRILMIIILCLAACLAVIFIIDWKERRSERRRLQSAEEQMQPLEEERTAVQEQLEQLEKEYDSQTSTTGAAQILFTDLDERIYTEAVPLMDSYDFTGILALSGTHYPGAAGCMSEAQVNELIKKGWMCCYMWEKGDTEDDISEMELSGYSFAVTSDFIYFEEEEYTGDYDTTLTELGYRAAIHHGEEDLPLVTGAEEGQVWHPGAVGLQGYQPRFRLEDAVSMDGNIVFTVGFEKEDEMYERDTFLSMLNYLQFYEENGELQMIDPGQAMQYFADAEEKRDRLEPEFEKRRTELEEELRRIEGAINGNSVSSSAGIIK